MLKQRIDQDIKQALLAGDKKRATTLRGLKSAILYAEVAGGNRASGLSDAETIDVLTREAKKRQESADLFGKGNEADRAQEELDEKSVIEEYLPKQLSDEQLGDVVDDILKELKVSSMQAMGPAIAEAKKRTAGQADGARIARMVQERIKSRQET